jgi:hypothetical protein
VSLNSLPNSSRVDLQYAALPDDDREGALPSVQPSPTLSHSSPLGALDEEITGFHADLLGNVPQAFSHPGLVNSVLSVDRMRNDRQPGSDPLGTEAETGEGVSVADAER